MTFAPAIAKAIEEIQSTYEGCRTQSESDGVGGAYVVVHDVPLGAPYVQSDTWIGFQITFQYPYADV